MLKLVDWLAESHGDPALKVIKIFEVLSAPHAAATRILLPN